MRNDYRSLGTIAAEIAHAWQNPYFGAVPYLRAMFNLDTLKDSYGLDSAREIVLYFLANANTWKGDTARRVKAELRGMLKASK